MSNSTGFILHIIAEPKSCQSKLAPSELLEGSLESPLVLSSDFFLLLGSEVVLDVEGLSDLLWRLALNHVCHSLTGQIQQVLDVQVVGSLIMTYDSIVSV